MDSNRRLGWIAIGIGVLALVVALGGHGREMRMGWHEGHGYQSPGYGQEWQAPSAPMMGEVAPPSPRGPMGREFSQHGPFGHGFGNRGPHGFMMFPFFLFGLFRLIGLIGLVVLVASILRRRRHGGPHGPHGHHHHGPQGPHDQDPESYTGKTTNL